MYLLLSLVINHFISSLKISVMKTLSLLLILPLLFSSFTIINKQEITEAERKFAVDHLNQTRTDLINAVQGLSDAQLNFKPAADRWSVSSTTPTLATLTAGSSSTAFRSRAVRAGSIQTSTTSPQPPKDLQPWP